MNCAEVRKLIHAHHDGELDAANTLHVDEHLADCPSCFATLRGLSALRTTLRNDALRFSAPAGLRRSIRAAVAQSAEAEREATPGRARGAQLGWVAAAVVFVAAIFAFQFRTERKDDHLVAELTASHVRSLMAAHLTDVTSTDQHTVKPWLDGKLDFAPPVRDFKESGFPLLGGRLEYVDGHSAAALVYGRQKHFINLFIWPQTAAALEKLKATQRNGYNVLQWADGKMNYAAVSDLNETELREFAGDWMVK
jgi:anti-sigma factor RsiW